MKDEEIINKTKKLVDKLKLGVLHKDADYTVERNQVRLRDKSEKEAIVVSFWAGPVEFADRPLYFAIMDIDTEEFLYIITPHGYIETT